MIQWMHKLSQSWVASLLMGALALSFVVWGIADVFIGNVSSDVAKVGRTAIGADVFQREYQSLIRSQSEQTGTQVTADDARRLGYDRTALQQLISRTALDNLANSEGIVTTDADVATAIRGTDTFKGPLGNFDHSTFLAQIQSAGYTEASFIDAMRADMNREQLTHALGNGFTIPAGYASALFMFLTERRAVDYFIIVPDAAGAVAPPGDDVLAAYVKAHAAQFSTPEYRDISYAMIAPADVAPQIQVTDSQIQQQYDAHKAEYVVPEKRDIEQIEFKDEADAEAARAKIASGMSFSALAASRGIKPADLALGTLTRDEIPDADRAAAAFGLAEGAVSEPVKSSFGWVLMHVTKITPGISKSLADVKDQIRADLQNQLAQSKLTDIANAYEDAVSGGASLTEAAKKVGMHTGHLAAIDAKGLGLDGKQAGAPTDPEFLDQAFKADIGEDGDPFPAKSGNTYAIRVNGSTPPKLKTLDAVRDQALAAWTADKRSALLAQKATALAKQAVADKSLETAAKSVGVPVQASAAITRTAATPPFTADLTEKIFEADAGTVVTGTDDKGDYVVAHITGIFHPPPDTAGTVFKNGQAQLSQQMVGDFMVALANAARDAQGVTVNQALVDQTVGQGQ